MYSWWEHYGLGDMSTSRRWLKWLTGCLVCVVCIVIGCGLLLAYLLFFGGHVLQSASNPAKSVTAEVIEDSSFAAATDAAYLGVAVKARWNPIRHYVFGGSDYGAQIQASWINDHVLLIHCIQCEQLRGNILKRKWNGVTICYDRSNMTDVSQDVDASCPKDTAPTMSHP